MKLRKSHSGGLLGLLVLSVAGCHHVASPQALPPRPSVAAVQAPVPVPSEASPAHARAYVTYLQEGLAAKGYYHGPVDGICGRQTREAVAAIRGAAGAVRHDDRDCRVGDLAWPDLSGVPAEQTAGEAQHGDEVLGH